MRIKLAYGQEDLVIDLDDAYEIDVLEPVFIDPFSAPKEKIKDSLRNPISFPPLYEWIKPGDVIGIILSDITRPMPYRIILPAILEEIKNIKNVEVRFFIALGSHRKNTDEELCQMLGDDIFENFLIIQNDAFDDSKQSYLGKTAFGHEIFINSDLFSCDRLILTGFIEPHFFAGFSGGGKAIIPGMAGIQTILKNHGPELISNPNATFGVTKGNPIWEEIREVCALFKNAFLVNVTLNKNKEITDVFSGDPIYAYEMGCKFVKETAMVPCHARYDIVITTNSGYPLDMNLYQSVKGMSAAARIVERGGSIIIASECREGIPEHGCYGSLLAKCNGPEELLDKITSATTITQDQWQAQIQAQIQLNAKVFVFSHYLSEAEINTTLLHPCDDIAVTVDTLMEKYGKNARICVLPEGPQTIPYIE